MALYQRGSQGPEVAKIQTRLQELGLYAGPIDGDFGGGTESAVKAFQKTKGLAVDGRVGPNTSVALFGVVPDKAAPISNVVVDLSHHNGSVDLAAAQQDGIAGIIHKATQGSGYTDPTYAAHRQQAQGIGLMWGAYHFGVGGDPNAQADHFLSVVQPSVTDLLVLDLESNNTGSSMTIDEAEDFVAHVQAVTGRWPGLYSGSYVKERLGNRTNTLLANCWFWLAQYGRAATVPPAWGTWTLWQYTDGAAGPEPYSVAGIGHCDRNKFNGDLDALKRFWGV